MGQLLAHVLPIALGAAVSPVVLLGAIAILSGPRPIPRGTAYTLGVTLVVVIQLAVGFLVITLTDKTGSTAKGPLDSPVLKLVLGVVILAIAASALRPKHDSSRGAGRLSRRLEDVGTPLGVFCAAGVGVTVINVSSLVLVLAILEDVAGSTVGLGAAAIVLAIVAAIVTAPASVPLLAGRFGGERARRGIDRAGAFLTHYGSAIVGAMLFVFGTQSLLTGLAGL